MKKSMISLAVATAMISLVGCGNQIPDMTQEQQALVVEYAAGEILKYDKNYSSKLNAEVLSEPEASDAQEGTPEQTPVPEQDPSPEPGAEQEPIAAAQEVPVIEKQAAIEELLGVPDVTFTYAGYELCDTYPTDQSEEAYFYMSATEGKKLLVLKFQTKNNSGAELTLNMEQTKSHFKIDVNGTRENALTTMLLNDMTYYEGTLGAGEETELVLVCEVPYDLQVETLGLEVKNVENAATISLQ